MNEVLKALRLAVDNTGYVAIAYMLGHKNTHNIYRWIRQDKIPESQVEGVRTILRQKGYLR